MEKIPGVLYAKLAKYAGLKIIPVIELFSTLI